MKFPITGFEPFGGETINPSPVAIRLLPCLSVEELVPERKPDIGRAYRRGKEKC